jgi:hypothetical protein
LSASFRSAIPPDNIFLLQFVAAWAALAFVGWAVWEFVKIEDARK